MKITFVSPYEDIVAYGVRVLSAYLKKFGHETKIVFLCKEKGSNGSMDSRLDEIMDDLVDICRDSGLIGISMMTNHFNSAISLTKGIKARLDIPVMWGGIHPTIKPEECIKYADIVCIGEGEIPMLELVEKMEKGDSYRDTKSLWFRDDGAVIRNSTGSRIANLDEVPFPDYDLSYHYMLRNGKLEKVEKTLLQEHFTPNRAGAGVKRSRSIGLIYRLFKPQSLKKQHAIRNLPKYVTLTSRGCPHNCTYCGNNALRKMHGTQPYLRRRSVEHIIGELTEAKKTMDYISMISFVDDNFFTPSEEELLKFSTLYKEKINLPFTCTVSPNTISRRKMDILVDAGLRLVKMGVESGSEQTLKLYNRSFMSNEKIKMAAAIINEYKGRVVAIFDLITDNPYESEEDIQKTLKLLLELPRPYRLQIYSLTPIPGTKLYDMARKDNLIQDEGKEIYGKTMETDKRINYVNFLYSLFNYNIPKVLLRILSQRRIIRLLDSKGFSWIYETAYRFNRRLKERSPQVP